MKIGIKVDTNARIGLGHLTRCISLNNQLLKKGINTVFLCNYLDTVKLLDGNHYHYSKLDKTRPDFINDKDYDQEYWKNEIEELEVDALIIDSYNINYDYLLNFKRYFKKIIYIDDLNLFDYPVDMIINGNIGAEELAYHSAEKKYLIGSKYNLIREEFNKNKKNPLNQKVNNILITSGGTNIHHVMNHILEVIVNHDIVNQYNFTVIIGNNFNNVDEIYNMIKGYKNIQLVSTYEFQYDFIEKKPMIDIMLSCDIAISSSGSTVYELCALGIPSLIYKLVDNQQLIINYLSKNEYVKKLGVYEELGINIIDGLQELISDYDLRKQMSTRCRHLIDCKGALRVASMIYEWVKEND